jgi:hypothetical protein
LEEVKKESICLKPRLDVNFLDDNIRDEKEKVEMIDKHQEEKHSNAKIMEHQQIFIRAIEMNALEVIKRNTLSDLCETIVTDILQKNEDDEVTKFN